MINPIDRTTSKLILLGSREKKDIYEAMQYSHNAILHESKKQQAAYEESVFLQRKESERLITL